MQERPSRPKGPHAVPVGALIRGAPAPVDDLEDPHLAMVYCRGCGKQIHETAIACPQCGAQQGLAATSSGEAMKYLLPVGRSGWAIAAGYLGLCSILILPAPFAIACGVLALRDIAKHPGRLGKPRAIFGIAMGCVGLLEIVLLRAFAA